MKHQDQTFLAIHEDFCPFLLVRNETDFNLYVAQTDLANPNPKSVLPHKESIDDRFLWYQMVLAKQSVFYTPPVVNDAFPEILNTEFGVVFACASADNIKWSQPIKVDENKKIIIIVPSFGELKLCINTLNKTAELTINYLEMVSMILFFLFLIHFIIKLQDRDSHVSNVQEKISNPTSNPDFNIPAKDKDYCQNASTLTSPKLTKLENHHKKTYMLSSINAKKRQLNLRVFFQGISLTLLKNGVHRNVDVVSFNIGEVQIEYLQKVKYINNYDD